MTLGPRERKEKKPTRTEIESPVESACLTVRITTIVRPTSERIERYGTERRGERESGKKKYNRVLLDLRSRKDLRATAQALCWRHRGEDDGTTVRIGASIRSMARDRSRREDRHRLTDVPTPICHQNLAPSNGCHGFEPVTHEKEWAEHPVRGTPTVAAMVRSCVENGANTYAIRVLVAATNAFGMARLIGPVCGATFSEYRYRTIVVLRTE
jgi:hypothetical protein